MTYVVGYFFADGRVETRGVGRWRDAVVFAEREERWPATFEASAPPESIPVMREHLFELREFRAPGGSRDGRWWCYVEASATDDRLHEIREGAIAAQAIGAFAWCLGDVGSA